MKTLFPVLLISILCMACNPSGKKTEEKLVYTMPEDSIKEATALIWVDKPATKDLNGVRTRRAKAKVDVDKEGKVTVIAFVKNYPDEVQDYIKDKLIDFRIDMVKLQAYIKPGEQFLQIKYCP